MRLIDTDACPALFDAEFNKTKSLILDGETHLDNLAEGFTEAHNVIRSMPTVDAVPVVRCKDCKHCILTGRSPFMYHACNRLGEIRAVDEDDFCKHGARPDRERTERE